ncbi:MAG: isopentenyl phosphate kinase family protein, partial [Candidatus Aenigmarchaeota archaeon]|nr:isopentenyl phosphate kinase family protein [Candidatus Aenigmarchaeota archaeon]
MKQLYLVKLGGSIITDKLKPYTANFEIINQLVKEIKEGKKEKDFNLILGHGGGSFPHTSAKKYKTAEGFVNDESRYGFCVVQNDAAKLNRIIVDSFLKAGEKAISIQPSACCIAKNSKISEFYLNPIKKLLEHNIIPIPYGDVGIDLKKGSCILSTEEILGFLARNLSEYKTRIIMVGKVEGVCTADPTKNENAEFIKEINKDNWDEIKNYLGGSDGTDVTGGMIHKIEQSVSLAKDGIEVEIISGMKKGNLKECLLGKRVGTLIKW